MDFMLQFSEPIREKVRKGELEIQGGVYDLQTGRVEFLGRSPRRAVALRVTFFVGRWVSCKALGETGRGLSSCLVGDFQWQAWPGSHRS